MTSRLFAVLAGGLLATVTSADPEKPTGSPAGTLAHMVALPAGAHMAVLDGDPSKEGLFVIRAKFPDGYTIPAHWHSADEHITVVSGSFGVGLGDTLDKSKIRYLPVGSYARMGKQERHYAVTKGETVIQVHAMGPFDLHYVNPADDPTKKSDK